MVLRSKQDYLESIRARYRRAGKKAKTIILDEFCAICGYNRKYAIRMLSKARQKGSRRDGRRPGPKTVYSDEKLVEALKRIWFASDQMCSKKLKAAIPLWLPFYNTEFEPLEETTKEKLLCVSSATIDRLIKPFRALHKRGRCTTRPGTLLKNQIPIKTEHWDVSQPGFFEADTVAHCGNSMAGDFVFSLTFTDILTGWTENRAVWGRGSQGVLRQIEDIETGIDFPILGFDCDNGSEFLNHHLVRYFTDRPKDPVMFTRSRPFQKNDNAFVEQKNWTHVRQLLGYDRFDRPELVGLINDLYKNEWRLFTNYFCPTLKLKMKMKINSRYVKTYEPPQTPCQRLLASEHINSEAKTNLKEVYNSLNPFTLKRKIEGKLRTIFTTLRLPQI
jgi:Transposase and inactivated derivatives, IS30 family